MVDKWTSRTIVRDFGWSFGLSLGILSGSPNHKQSCRIGKAHVDELWSQFCEHICERPHIWKTACVCGCVRRCERARACVCVWVCVWVSASVTVAARIIMREDLILDMREDVTLGVSPHR